MDPKVDTTARLAARQHGRVAWRQLVAAGVDAEQIKRWLASGRLRPVHKGVYAVGHAAPSLHADYMAAVLACGEGAVISHRAAAHLLQLVPGRAPPPEVTVPTTSGRRRPGVVVHRVRQLPARDRTTIDGIPVTTAPRTLLDLAIRLSPQQLARACHEAWVRHRTTPRLIEACIERNPTKKGVAKLRIALGSDFTLSDLEEGFLALLRAHGMPLPRTNIGRHGDTVDCHWPDLGITVELVSYRYHGSRAAFESDVARRRRSNHLAFSWGDVFERGTLTVAELAPALSSAGRERRRPDDADVIDVDGPRRLRAAPRPAELARRHGPQVGSRHTDTQRVRVAARAPILEGDMTDPFIGEISIFAGNFAPKGWAFCNGQLLQINQHQALFSLLGTSYGGDGKRTFALPDLRSRVPVHAGTGPGLPEVALGEMGGSIPQGVEDASGYSAGPYTGVNFIIALQGIFPSRDD